ncbi:MAG: 50S ribosomal protein L37ae [archaeon]
MATKKVGTTGRFGARYGRRLKVKVADIEKKLRGKHKCPYCNKLKAKRIASGIWICKNCNSKFTGKAYSI